ncbi:hypothetical protein B9479_000584 [Cryptococcus floricola]|uniref:Thioredoxin domain-containing protein n=1 Tax=Cryptococcus floricola TaxID=2591691 RepID=A0A5D3B6W5_9TREE|nr:hypothetical protein B9479_000584 [Cryptococcus floricola]
MNPFRTTLLHASTSFRSSARRAAAPVVTRPAAQLPWKRCFADSPKPPKGGLDTEQQKARDQSTVGPFTLKAAGFFIVTGVGLYMYFESEKTKVQERRQEELASRSVGRPNIGGPFQLTTQDGVPFTEQDLKGKWSLIYFGFTHCPDICPEELDKMGEAVDMVDKATGKGEVLPVFITVDPARDTLPQVKKYIKEFHPRMVGLVGDYEQVKKTCKVYRVYFSTPPDATAADDYLVDHSIFFYLMDPLGQFVDAFGKATTADQVASKVLDSMKKWEAAGGNAAAGV